VRRSDRRPAADLYAFNVQHPIPTFPLPLREGDREPVIDLQTLLEGVYDRAGYDLAIDYARESIPPLGEEDTSGLDGLLRDRGLRKSQIWILARGWGRILPFQKL
jgi:Protein of unknown function (DUF4058)